MHGAGFSWVSPQTDFLPFSAQLYSDICASPVSLGRMTCSWFWQWENGIFRRLENFWVFLPLLLFVSVSLF